MPQIHYRSLKKYKYQLVEPYSMKTDILSHGDIVTEYITLWRDGTLVIRHGYAWDGPSGPTIDTRSFLRGSLVHDALYQLMRMGLLSQDCREPADQLLRKTCLDDGMWPVRAWWVYHAVRLAAASCAAVTDKPEMEVLTAP